MSFLPVIFSPDSVWARVAGERGGASPFSGSHLVIISWRQTFGDDRVDLGQRSGQCLIPGE